MRRVSLASLALAIVLVFAARPAAAQAPPVTTTAPAPLPPDSWAAQLDTLVRWADQRRDARACAQRCFALQRMHLAGTLEPDALTFELEGAVLADGPVAIPLFGPPDKVRVEAVTEDGRPAAVSFDDEGYFLHTASRRFVLRGRIAFQRDLALTIIGPLNTLDTSLTGARVVEGARLAGLRNTTIHLDRGAAELPAAGPTVFQLSHAVRVGREIGFTSRLVLRSGADLGVVRLPLRFGERVLEVTGSTGWRVDGSELLLPTSGSQAEVTITGTLPRVTTFTPDPRSEYEWWLLESDAEHRIAVGGDAHQIDSSESPIPRTQPSARLFLVQRGQRIEPTVQTLTSVEALAAVVHAHERTVVVTRQGDVVTDDTLRYENNGIDYLLYDPRARPIFLATDGTAERIMHRGDAREILVPLRTGSHTARVQALGHIDLNTFAGWARFETPSHPLATSRVSLTLGLPPGVYPVAVLGGDEASFAFEADDAFALLVALVTALVALRTWRRRALGTLALAGAWFASPALFVALVVTLCFAGAFWLAGRLLSGGLGTLVKVAFAGAAGLALLVGVGAMLTMSARSTRSSSDVARTEAAAAYDQEGGTGTRHGGDEGRVGGRASLGNVFAQNAVEGVLQGVTPVALTLPAYERAVHPRRELVTRERPFKPAVLYVTTWAIAPVALAWLACVAALAWSLRRELEALRDRVRARIDRGPTTTAA
jgi:hypothetical protein